MKINKDRRIGNVLFIVEGNKTEFNLLRQIFERVLGYSFLERKRNSDKWEFVKSDDPYSMVIVINSETSNIKSIEDSSGFLEDLYTELITTYHLDFENVAVYYLFDRDPQSNKDVRYIKELIDRMKSPIDNGNDEAGQLLLSYPAVESFLVSCFIENSYNLQFRLGNKVKKYVGENSIIQIQNIREESLKHATEEFLKYLGDEGIDIENINIDKFNETSFNVFEKQEENLAERGGYRLFSMLTLAFLQMDIMSLEE